MKDNTEYIKKLEEKEINNNRNIELIKKEMNEIYNKINLKDKEIKNIIKENEDKNIKINEEQNKEINKKIEYFDNNYNNLKEIIISDINNP